MRGTIPTTIRLAPTEKTRLEARAIAAGLSVSDYVRRELDLRGEPIDAIRVSQSIDDLDRRLSRLEELAGL